MKYLHASHQRSSAFFFASGRIVGMAATLVLAFGAMGSDCFSTDGGSDGGYVGPGAPSVEVTVDGTHVGPWTADATSYADLATTRDDAGQIVTTDLLIHVASAAGSNPAASCDLHFDRFGMNVPGFAAGITTLEAPVGDATSQGTTASVGPLSVVAGALTLQCNGSDCNGGILSISAMDANHVEGFVSGTFADPSDGQQSSTVCTFYVPWRSYSP
jgi:hypothetical protein